LSLTLVLLAIAVVLILAWILCRIAWILLETAIEYTEEKWEKADSAGQRVRLGAYWLLLRMLWLTGWCVLLTYAIVTLLFMANDIKEKVLDRQSGWH